MNSTLIIMVFLIFLLLCIIFAIIISISLKRRKIELTPEYSEKDTSDTVFVSPMRPMGLIVELCFIVMGFFAINYLIENVLDPDYTVDWEVYANYDALDASGYSQSDIIKVTQDIKDSYLNGIMRQRQSNRLGLFFSFGFLIAGYYCAKAAGNEIRRRGVIIPADGMETLDSDTIASNRRIVVMRFVSILMVMAFIIMACDVKAMQVIV